VRAREQVFDVHDLVCDADTAGEEEHGAIRIQAVVSTVGALDEAEAVEAFGGRVAGAVVHLASEACAGAADKADGVAALGSVGGDAAFELGHGTFLREGRWVGPGNGERMRVWAHERGHIEMDVAPRAGSPLAGEGDGNAAGLAGHGFDVDFASLLTSVVPQGIGDAGDPFEDVEGGHEAHPRKLWKSMPSEMLPKTDESEEDAQAVDAQEGLVEGVTEGGPGLDAQEDKAAGSHHTPCVRRLIAKAFGDGTEALGLKGVVQPACRVHNGFDDGDASSPAVEQIEVVVRDLEQGDERVIAECEEDRGNEVERCKGSGAAPQSSHDGSSFGLFPGKCQTPGQVQRTVDDENDEVPTARQRAVVDGRRDLECAVVLLLVKRGHEEMSIQPWPPPGGIPLPILLSLRITHDCQMPCMSKEHAREP